MLKGTQLLIGEDALRFETVCDVLCMSALAAGYERVYLPATWDCKLFAGEENLVTLQDSNNVCLVPEPARLVQDRFSNDWAKALPLPVKVYYLTHCCRFKDVEDGGLQEFTELGIEYLGKVDETIEAEIVKVLENILERTLDDKYEWNSNTLEATANGVCIAKCDKHKHGMGWVIKVEDLLEAINKQGE